MHTLQSISKLKPWLRDRPAIANLTGQGILVLSNLEMLFAYHVELNQLRTLAADEDRVLLLLPDRRAGGGTDHRVPGNERRRLHAAHQPDGGNHLWEIKDSR